VNEGDVGGGEVDEIVDRAQAEIYQVTERRTSEDYVVLEELLQPAMDEIDAIAMAGGQAAGVPTGFADLDNLTNGLHPGQMIIVAAHTRRPGIGKSTLALDIARHAAVKHRKTAVIFSLEMSKTEITMRLLSAEAGIRLSQMHVGGDLNPGAVPAAGTVGCRLPGRRWRWPRRGVRGLDPRASAGPEGQDQRVAPCGQVTSPVSRQTASSAICATERPTPRLERSRPPAWLASRSAPAPAASSAFWARTLRFGRRHIDPGR
jgi:DnaB-like helicase C terminal domain